MISDKERRDWGTDDTPRRRDAWASLLLATDEAISPTPTQYEGLAARYESLCEILDVPHNPVFKSLLLFAQGSFSTRTVTRPPGREELDVDAIAYLKDGTALAPTDLLEQLFVELNNRSRTGGTVKLSKRCVTIKYADKSLPCHLDVTPAVARTSNGHRDGHGRLLVPDHSIEDWSPSNPKDFAQWFNTLAEIDISVQIPAGFRALLEKRAEAEPLPSYEEISSTDILRVTTRLAKRHRDLFVARTGKHDTKPISVLLTTLIGKAYEQLCRQTHGQSLTAYNAIEGIVELMPKQFDAPRQGQRHWLENPCDADENFAEKWNRDAAYKTTFDIWYNQFQQALQLGFVNCRREDRFRKELVSAFGHASGIACDDFFEHVRDQAHPGLSADAANRARLAGRSAGLMGLGSKEPAQAAKPESVGRLG